MAISVLRNSGGKASSVSAKRLGGKPVPRSGIHQRQPAAGDPEQPRNHAQQRGFAGAVAPGDQQGLAAADGKTQPGKHLAAAPDAGQAACLKPHRRRPAGWPSLGMPATQSPTFELFSFV